MSIIMSYNFYQNSGSPTNTDPTNSNYDLTKQCRKCGARLSADDRGIYMKLVTRSATDFMCMACLAPELNTTKENLQKLADHYRESGECVLFR